MVGPFRVVELAFAPIGALLTWRREDGVIIDPIGEQGTLLIYNSRSAGVYMAMSPLHNVTG